MIQPLLARTCILGSSTLLTYGPAGLAAILAEEKENTLVWHLAACRTACARCSASSALTLLVLVVARAWQCLVT